MYINGQCKTSWSPLGFQVANLAPTLLKPMARGRISLLAGDAGRPCVEFNFTGHELDLKRFMQGFRSSSWPVKRSEEHTSELQSQSNLVCRLLLEKKKNNIHIRRTQV